MEINSKTFDIARGLILRVEVRLAQAVAAKDWQKAALLDAHLDGMKETVALFEDAATAPESKA